MRLLVDENIDRPIVLLLRDLGHDVVEVAAAAKVRPTQVLLSEVETMTGC